MFVIDEHPDRLTLCFAILKSIMRMNYPNRAAIAACTIFDHPQSPDTARRAMVALNRAAREFLHLELQCLGAVHHGPAPQSKQEIQRNDREVRTIARRLAGRLRIARSRQRQLRLVASANG